MIDSKFDQNNFRFKMASQRGAQDSPQIDQNSTSEKHKPSDSSMNIVLPYKAQNATVGKFK